MGGILVKLDGQFEVIELTGGLGGFRVLVVK